jgi:hypothetical protein
MVTIENRASGARRFPYGNLLILNGRVFPGGLFSFSRRCARFPAVSCIRRNAHVRRSVARRSFEVLETRSGQQLFNRKQQFAY